MTGFTPTENHRPGRMLAALIASENRKGRMELTVTVTPASGGQALHRAFSIKRWAPANGGYARLFIAIPDSADWGAGIKPATPLQVNLENGEIRVETNDPRVTPLLVYAARAALRYAQTGAAPTPANGTVTVQESLLCGHCGIKLKDPVSIERGIGPVCFGKVTGSRAIAVGSAATDGTNRTTSVTAQVAPSQSDKPSIRQLAMQIEGQLPQVAA